MSNDETIPGRQRRYYQELFRRHGDDPRSVAFRDRETQDERFRRLLGVVPPGEARAGVHEVGCGLGDLGDLLDRERPGLAYSGSDLVPEFVEHCRRRFPDRRFDCLDFLAAGPERAFDYVVLSGALNPRRETAPEEWDGFVRAMLSRMYAACRRGIAANFLTVHHDADRRDPELHYQDPGALIEFVVGHLSRHYELDAGGPLFEFTLRVHRPEAVRDRYPGEAFRRYVDR